MAHIDIRGRLQILGGEIQFNFEDDNVKLPNKMYIAAGFVVGAATTLAVLYGVPYFKPLIEEAIERALAGVDQKIQQIFTGSLHVVLHCSTAERFLEVLADYESGKIKERLEKEFSKLDFKVEGLKVEIEKIKEVKGKEATDIERLNQKVIECSLADDNSLPEGNISPRVIVQGGVYRSMDPGLKEEYERVTKQSAREGYATLMNGGTAVDAVEAAVRVLERNELFNAGRGSFLNCDGEVECDAMIMEGDTLKNGAVITGKHFLHPVSLAKKIMTESPHCALSGDGAFNFAEKQNIPRCAPKELVSRQRTLVSQKDHPDWVNFNYQNRPREQIGDGPLVSALDKNSVTPNAIGDTVSAVAMDSKGVLACATSTGGIAGKLKGRVGDAPLIGCGAYANKDGSATCAGHGESIMKVTLARQAVYNMENGQNAQESAENAMKKMEIDVEGLGGIIAIDKNGNFGKAFNTHLMVWASIKGETLTSGMDKGESVDEPYIAPALAEN